MDPLWIAVAFLLGFTVKQVGLPPLVGFLAAGFVLNIFGVEGGQTLDRIADFGVLLLLFSIGLKCTCSSLSLFSEQDFLRSA
jgi:predicted Kef-type K+ transport protein